MQGQKKITAKLSLSFLAYKLKRAIKMVEKKTLIAAMRA